MAYKVVDLFAGAGGLSLGFMQTGKFEIVAAAENNPGARKTYKRNHKLTRLYPDVRTIDYRELEESALSRFLQCKSAAYYHYQHEQSSGQGVCSGGSRAGARSVCYGKCGYAQI